MFPAYPLANLTNCSGLDAEIMADFKRRPRIYSDLANSIVSEFGQRMSLSALLSSLYFAVGHILLMCAEKQMIRIDTRWIVATMTDFKTIRQLAVLEHPREAVGIDLRGACRRAFVIVKHAIAICIQLRLPDPTGFSFQNLRPEAVNKSKLWFSHAILRRSVVRGAAGIQALPRFAIIA